MTHEEAERWLPRLRQAVPHMLVQANEGRRRDHVVITVKEHDAQGRLRVLTIVENVREAAEFCEDHTR